MAKLELKHVEHYLPNLKVMDCDSDDVQEVINFFERENGTNFNLTNGLCHITNMTLLIEPKDDVFGLIEKGLAKNILELETVTLIEAEK